MLLMVSIGTPASRVTSEANEWRLRWNKIGKQSTGNKKKG
jgi:hypothetical protein